MGICACAGPAFLVLWDIVAQEPGSLRSALSGYGLAGRSWWVFVIYYATVHPVLEECYWRGYLASDSPRPAAIDLTFAGYHALVLPHFIRAPWVVLACGVLFLTAWGWRRLAQKCGGLGIPIVSHAAADLSLVFAVELIARRGA